MLTISQPGLHQNLRQTLSLLLMLFLLLTQQASLSHAVSDLATAASSAAAAGANQALDGDQQNSPPHAAELCGAAAQFTAALPASPLRLAPACPRGFVRAAVPARGFHATPALAFRARAPPSA